ncbi:MAG: endonuclease/exonuclease/phosphatase family protein, partial [Beijerinckiaceae bacterium]
RTGPLRLMTTHLEYSHPDLRRDQVEAIRGIHAGACARAVLAREDGPHTYARTPEATSAILCGDFNMRPDDPMKHRLSDAFEGAAPRLLDAWTIRNGDAPHPVTACIVDQSYAPPHCCDYVFVSEDIAPGLRSFTCDLGTRVSDHQPILIEIDL